MKRVSAASRTSRLATTSEIALTRAEALIGAPYKHLGRTRKGIDCLGLFIDAYAIDEAGCAEAISLREATRAYYGERAWHFDAGNPNHRKASAALEAFLRRCFVEVPREEAVPGDALALSFKDRRHGMIDHMAIYAGRHTMIHTDMRKGVEKTDIPDGVWRRGIVGFFRKVD